MNSVTGIKSPLMLTCVLIQLAHKWESENMEKQTPSHLVLELPMREMRRKSLHYNNSADSLKHLKFLSILAIQDCSENLDAGTFEIVEFRNSRRDKDVRPGTFININENPCVT